MVRESRRLAGGGATLNAPAARVVGVTGGSGSGKSLFARALAARLGAEAVALISEDDYYRAVDEPGFDPRRFDFDAPSARDHALLAAHLLRLRQGEAVDRPVYSFRTHAPLKRRVRAGPAAWVIIEGLHVLHDPAVRSAIDFSVFLDVDADIRFIRRLLRDTRERGRSVRGVSAQYLTTVKPAHDRFVEPAKVAADLVLRCETDEADAATLERWLDTTLEALGKARGDH